jgi:hypothetical protein
MTEGSLSENDRPIRGAGEAQIATLAVATEKKTYGIMRKSQKILTSMTMMTNNAIVTSRFKSRIPR